MFAVKKETKIKSGHFLFPLICLAAKFSAHTPASLHPSSISHFTRSPQSPHTPSPAGYRLSYLSSWLWSHGQICTFWSWGTRLLDQCVCWPNAWTWYTWCFQSVLGVSNVWVRKVGTCEDWCQFRLSEWNVSPLNHFCLIKDDSFEFFCPFLYLCE